MVRALSHLLPKLKRHDRKLAEQIKQAADSAAACLSEGSHRRGGDRPHLYSIAGGSAAEVHTHLVVAAAWGYLADGDGDAAAALADRVAAMCWRLCHSKR
jgi:four helix bundle protein